MKKQQVPFLVRLNDNHATDLICCSV